MQRRALLAVSVCVALGVVSVGARRGRADGAPNNPIARGAAATSALASAPPLSHSPSPPFAPSFAPSFVPSSVPSFVPSFVPPSDPAASTADSVPHLLVTPPNYTLVDATWDRPIRVLPAPEASTRALVYLHGYCGDVNAPGAFVSAAAAHGTLIALLGDQPCKDKPGRFKWSNDIHGLDERIKRAIRLVNRSLKLELDAKDITLFGYSQGAVRAESLARYYGKHYPRVILGGPPRRPKPQHFTGVRTVAVFGGELEDTQDMLGGAGDMVAAGEHARFFLFPGVDHGDFGGEIAGNRSIGEVLNFVDPPKIPPDSAVASGVMTAAGK